eukprot:CAMPEP_0196735024 /NCGR_PEP_ID=MMETSP1091-20130531/13595_1 /TAXON_ID=302021 /ORGANISM="Rhodomonas sp., Strain CCMP768" /LENGTH=130 /DNA_ID=CAMNT_0042078621 /DNA_START=549 /DNA_END=942 /DNA_ORIENTATION=-
MASSVPAGKLGSEYGASAGAESADEVRQPERQMVRAQPEANLKLPEGRTSGYGPGVPMAAAVLARAGPSPKSPLFSPGRARVTPAAPRVGELGARGWVLSELACKATAERSFENLQVVLRADAGELFLTF